MLEFVKPNYIGLKSLPEYNERWLHERLIEDTSLLGLGDLDLLGSEKTQPSGGRLDLLFADSDSGARYTVEIQLGQLDESHIVRTIEYWDIERRRYPQYEHIAVIVAEDITSRFLNVIGLLHHSIPLIAIQLQAVSINGALTLVATRVHDYVPPGPEDEEAGALVDRSWWERKSSSQGMELVDQLWSIAKNCEAGVDLRYNRAYIGIYTATGRQAVIMRPRKRGTVATEFKVPESEQLTEEIENSALVPIGEYNQRWGHHYIRVQHVNFQQPESSSLIERLICLACGSASASS